MKRSLIFDDGFDQLRALVSEDGRICECHTGDENSAGMFYRGVVRRVVKGMNAAFVDIGLEQNAFLSFDDIPPAMLPLKQEQVVLAQILKQPGGDKGARLTLKPALAGRLMVLHPNGSGAIHFSRKFTPDERAQCDALFDGLALADADIVARTLAPQSTRDALLEERDRLAGDYEAIKAAFSAALSPAPLDAGDGLVERMVRNFCGDALVAIRASKTLETRVRAALARWASGYESLLSIEDGPLLSAADEKILKQARARTVYLDCGAHLVIDAAEALTAIDVNTGKCTGPQALALSNREAAAEIARQIRLRDISGMIAIDFVDQGATLRSRLIDALREALFDDRGQPQILPEGPGGLVLIIRKKRMPSWVEAETVLCPRCRGAGRVDSLDAAARDALRKAALKGPDGVIYAPKAVLDAIRRIAPASSFSLREHAQAKGEE